MLASTYQFPQDLVPLSVALHQSLPPTPDRRRCSQRRSLRRQHPHVCAVHRAQVTAARRFRPQPPYRLHQWLLSTLWPGDPQFKRRFHRACTPLRPLRGTAGPCNPNPTWYRRSCTPPSSMFTWSPLPGQACQTNGVCHTLRANHAPVANTPAGVRCAVVGVAAAMWHPGLLQRTPQLLQSVARAR